MATDVQVYNLVQATSSDFEKRCTMRLFKLARDILNDQGSNTADRIAWAQSVRDDPLSMARSMKWAIMEDADVYSAEEPDSTADDSWRQAKIEAAASALIDTFAAGMA